MKTLIHIPDIGPVAPGEGLIFRARSSDGRFQAGCDGVSAVLATGDGKVEFIAFARHTLACVNSAMGYPAYYPVYPVQPQRPVEAVLMDLDGTSVRSETFWVWVIQLTVAGLLANPRFELEGADLPYVVGHSVSEHLRYCLNKYCPHKTVEEARQAYFGHARREMAEIAAGRGRQDAFQPVEGLKEFLLALKGQGIRIGLVTSGLYEKAWPEILAAFRQLDLGDPRQFYDAIITGGFAVRPGEAGTLGELSPKPHPWLYAEAGRVGLGIDPDRRQRVVGIEDSGAGVCSIRLAGFTTVGLAGGNINESGARPLCNFYAERLEEVLGFIEGRLWA